MSQNGGNSNRNFRNNNRNRQDQSHGIFGEAAESGSLKQKLPLDAFISNKPKSEKTLQPRQNYEERRAVQPKLQPSFVQSTPRHFFVFDIETVPCIETARTFLNLDSSVSEDEVLQKLIAYHSEITNGQNEFFRQLFHKIVCISFISGIIHPLKGGKEKYIIKTIRSGGRNGESEEEIIKGVFTFLGKHPSRLISFNGRGFDLPVLQYRAMKYGIDAKWIYGDGYYNYNHRYSIEKHCDLLEMFSNFGASARIKMAEVASLFKIPCKSNGVDGSDVFNLYKAGELNKIADYCESDVITTYILYLRFMQHSGKLSAEGYNIVVDNLIQLLQKPEQPAHHTLFAEQFLKMNSGNIYIGNFTRQEANTDSNTNNDEIQEEHNSEDSSNSDDEPENSELENEEDLHENQPEEALPEEETLEESK